MAEDIPNVIYHYTSMKVLLEIVRLEQLWATNIRYLNDVNERDHFVGLFQSRAPKEFENDPIWREPAWQMQTYESLMNGLCTAKPILDYPAVVSFSTEKDSLSQWMSYCRNGNGVCIGFRKESLVGASVIRQVQLNLSGTMVPMPVPVVLDAVQYVSQNDGDRIDELIRQTIDNAKASMEGMRQKNPGFLVPFGAFLAGELERRACTCKDSPFAHEREFRLIAAPALVGKQFYDFRPSNLSLVPYIPLTMKSPDHVEPNDLLTVPHEKAARHFIESVVVGPTPNSDLSSRAVKAMFESKGYSVFVEPSHIPFRDWL